jgi:hypothetical protein
VQCLWGYSPCFSGPRPRGRARNKPGKYRHRLVELLVNNSPQGIFDLWRTNVWDICQELRVIKQYRLEGATAKRSYRQGPLFKPGEVPAPPLVR